MLAADSGTYVPYILAILGTGGVVGAIAAFFKIRPEAGQIAVTASEGALIVQTGVIENLHKDNKQLRDRLEDMESKVALMFDLRDRVEALEDERDALRKDNEKLRRRIVTLEKQIREMGAEPANGNGAH
jgi:chaperonin cofactor prefoldin